MIKGNSTMACPDAIFNPIKDPYLLPYRILIKNKRSRRQDSRSRD